MNALSIAILTVLAGVVLAAPRRWALLGIMASVLYLTQYQQVRLGGVNMFPHRFIEVAAFLRILLRGELAGLRLNRIDWGVLVLYGYTTIVYLLRETDSAAYIIGQAVDAYLCYFAFRCLVADVAEFRWFLKAFLFVLTPYMVLLFREHFARHSMFTALGAVEGLVTRDDDSVRCCGSFRYASLLGTLGASFLPVYFGLWFDRNERRVAWIGMAFCACIVWLSNSGGPINAAAIAMVGWLLWPLRTRMRLVRWGILAWIGLAAMVMKAPVWYLIAKVSDLTGGDGWHRSYLIDVSFRHLHQWWLAGMRDELTVDWFPYVVRSTGFADITNAYISFGLSAGLVSMFLFIALLSKAFSEIGKAFSLLRLDPEGLDGTGYLVWAMGAMLASHVANWFGVTYWDQTYMVWFMQLAVIANLTQWVLSRPPESSDSPGHAVYQGAEPESAAEGVLVA